jgi:hypothetical protein
MEKGNALKNAGNKEKNKGRHFSRRGTLPPL